VGKLLKTGGESKPRRRRVLNSHNIRMTEHKGATSKSQLDAARRKMRERLAQFPGESYTEGWSSLWKDKAPDDRLPWDRGFPNPGLEDTLLQKGALLGGPLTEGPEGRRRKKVLVPGCGTGVDVLLFASFGYDAYGLEYSQVAVDLCKTREAEDREKYVVRDAAIGRGNATFIQGDFFKEDWLEKLGLERNCFELIYDYTVCRLKRSIFAACNALRRCDSICCPFHPVYPSWLISTPVLLCIATIFTPAMGSSSCSASRAVSNRKADLLRVPNHQRPPGSGAALRVPVQRVSRTPQPSWRRYLI
jgi:SAM-dependent methyltransferase